MKRKPRRRSSTISATTVVDAALRGFWPSVRHTEQNEQCFGQPRTVCTERPHVACPVGSRSQRAGRNASPSIAAALVAARCGVPAAQSASTDAQISRRRRAPRRAPRRARGTRPG